MRSRIENVNAVTTKSGRVLNPVAPQGKSPELAIDLEETEPEEMIPSMKRYVKGLVTSKVSGEDDFVKVSRDCSAPVNEEDGCLYEFGWSCKESSSSSFSCAIC
ncbi:unnamed protein product [Arabis nemorensis]|uniref:Uncharacterized protein n=1 Tax=Arabis nemorensis TaxID=586526 RepID=A0A565BJR3_9BRAS|nr:unnamed protein product [Arabis nemorensis]